MKKYYIGLGFFGLVTLCLAGYIAILGVQTRQDIETDKKANQIAEQLNSYTDRSNTIPKDLATAGVTNSPKTVSYQKLTEETYKFCVTYKQTRGYGDGNITTSLTTAATSKLYGFDTQVSIDTPAQPTYLYISYTHGKGQICQTIKPYLYAISKTLPNSTAPALNDPDYCDQNSPNYIYYKDFCITDLPKTIVN